MTQEGLDAGMFGAPSFIVRQDGHDDKLFFGQGEPYPVSHHDSYPYLDRIEILCNELGVPYYGPALDGRV